MESEGRGGHLSIGCNDINIGCDVTNIGGDVSGVTFTNEDTINLGSGDALSVLATAIRPRLMNNAMRNMSPQMHTAVRAMPTSASVIRSLRGVCFRGVCIFNQIG